MVTQTGNSIRLNLVRQIDDSYNVVVGANLFPQIAQELKRDFPTVSKYAIITDSNVLELYGGKLDLCLGGQGLNSKLFSFPAGEKNKNMDTVNKLLNQLGKAKYNRDSLVIALGGGVVGDTAGLVASLINRGVAYVQIPTTTIAQADSAVGGKTGVDLPSGKNLAGVIRQPQRVYVDVETLRTLDSRNYRSGLVESVKHGVIKDANFFGWIEENMEVILKKDQQALIYLAKQNTRIKGEIVEMDPDEKSLRKILNYGHTIGHAIETASRYSLLHGEAVSLGMMVEAAIARASGDFLYEDLERQNNLLRRVTGLDEIPRIPQKISNDTILKLTLGDKKASGGKATYALPKRIGEMKDYGGKYSTTIDDRLVIDALNSYR
jgi:3-dehydroquinate synthase